MVEKLSEGNFYRDSCVTEGVIKKEMSAIEMHVPIQGWNEVDQFQLHREALQWIDYEGDEIVVL